MPDRTLIAVVDGAGGVAGGVQAAESICRGLADDASDWESWMRKQDGTLAARGTGLAAAVVLSIADDGVIRGASVGDCGAWVIERDVADLTSAQVRKPLLGDGHAAPVGFTARWSGGTLIMATDGLWKYLSHALIVEFAARRPLEAALDALVDGVRLPSGGLQDDIAIVLCARDAGLPQ